MATRDRSCLKYSSQISRNSGSSLPSRLTSAADNHAPISSSITRLTMSMISWSVTIQFNVLIVDCETIVQESVQGEKQTQGNNNVNKIIPAFYSTRLAASLTGLSMTECTFHPTGSFSTKSIA